MSSCCLCHLLPRTAGIASGLIINPGRGGGLAEVGLGPSQGQHCVCVSAWLTQTVCWPASPGLVCVGADCDTSYWEKG